MMKKNYLFTVVLCVLSLFTSCNDDKDDSSSVYVGDSLKLTLSGTTLSGKAVATDNTTITLNNVIPGEAELTLPITYTADGFIGKVKNEYREVEVDATVRDGVAEVKVNLTEINPLGGNTFATNAQSLRLDFATPKEKITFMGTDYDAKMLPVLVESQVSPMLSQLLKGIRFGADGVIVVEFIKEGGTHLTLGGYAFCGRRQNICVSEYAGHSIKIEYKSVRVYCFNVRWRRHTIRSFYQGQRCFLHAHPRNLASCG